MGFSFLGWMNIHLPPIFDVHQGYKVLTHSHMGSHGGSVCGEVLVVAVVHLVIPRVPSEVVEHKQREREVEAFFMGCGQGVKRSDCATPACQKREWWGACACGGGGGGQLPV